MGKSRRQRIYDNNRTEIMKVARNVFAEKGYDKATISEIAAAADFSVGTIYNFFESKKDLFEAMVEDQVELLMNGIKELNIKYPNPFDRLTSSFDWICDLVEKQKDLMKIWIDTSAIPFGKLVLSKNQMHMKEAIVKSTEDNFAKSIENGYIVESDPHYLTIAYHSLIDAFIHDYITNPGSKSLREILEVAKSIFFKSVVTEKGRLEFQ